MFGISGGDGTVHAVYAGPILTFHLRQCEEKFFSRNVTHVVTTRQVPATALSVKQETAQQSKEPQMNAPSAKTTNMLDNTLQRRAQTFQPPARAADVLTRARELNIKIWTYEKLQRVLKSMLDTETGEPMQDTKTSAQQPGQSHVFLTGVGVFPTAHEVHHRH